jgi:hypothetical protein
MDPYAIALFVHILGALGLFIAIGLEWLSLGRLGTATTREQAAEWLGIMGVVRRIGPASLVLILLAGLYMAAVRWGFDGWTGAALVGFAGLLLLGGLFTGRSTLALERAIREEREVLSATFLGRLGDATVRRAFWTRVGLAIGIVALMVFKPDLLTGSLALVAAALAGLILGIALTRDRAATASAT